MRDIILAVLFPLGAFFAGLVVYWIADRDARKHG